MSNNFFHKIKENLIKSKQEIVKAKENFDPDKLKEKIDPYLKNIKEANDINKQKGKEIMDNLNSLYSNKMKDVDKFVGSNSAFWHYYSKLKNISKDKFSSYKTNPIEKSKFSFKDFFSFKKTFFVGSIKSRLRTFGIKLFCLYICYLGIKIVYHRAIDSYKHGNPYETMRQLEEIKRQNDEIIRRNKELMEENRRYKGL